MPDISYSNTSAVVPIQSAVTYAANTNYTVASDVGTVAVDTSAGNVTITIPHFNNVITVKKTSTDQNKMIIQPQTGQIEGQPNYITMSTSRPSYNIKDDGQNFWLV